MANDKFVSLGMTQPSDQPSVRGKEAVKIAQNCHHNWLDSGALVLLTWVEELNN